MEAPLSFLKKIIPRPIFQALQPVYHLFLSAFAALYYGFPSHRLIVIGITGTDGKTTVVHILHEIFRTAGHKVGSLSSLRFKINDREEPNLLKMTMPGRMRLQKFLSDCRKAGCKFAIIEVTSQGVLQFRHRFIRFSAAVLTNISPEHVEAHGGFENYQQAKMELFQGLPASGFAVLNQEDGSSELFAASSRAEPVWYSRSEITLKRIGHPVHVLTVHPDKIQLEIDEFFFESGLGGIFNVMNILAASASAMAFDVSLSAIASAISQLEGVPGRLEYLQHQPFSVVVDYANTPNALESVYKTLSSANPKSEIRNPKLICVFGAPGGGRDKWKRPELGRIASRFCKEIILTSDDPDEENPASIAEEIQAGIPKGEFSTDSTGSPQAGSNNKIYSSSGVEKIPSVKVILDRREAIREGLKSARPGDTVIITGMGAQPWLVVKGKKIPWDDRKVVSEELEAIKNQ